MAKKKNKGFVSNCNGKQFRGSVDQIAARYKELAEGCRDAALAQLYLNHYEHYSKCLDHRK